MRIRFALVGLLAAASVFGQPFNPGSDGSDGDLTFPSAKMGDVIVFDPRDTTMTLSPQVLDKDNDNVYHFKTIVIPAGVRVVLRANKLGGPIYWLAQGNVTISGHLDASGDNGAPAGLQPQSFAVPGPGGFHGGSGGNRSDRPPTAGLGPKGGRQAIPPYSGCAAIARGGGVSVNDFLVPLVGGSGGGGWGEGSPTTGAGGGGGGGAILIASPGTIDIRSGGFITAKGGGAENYAGYGGGGSIRLMANRIQGSGTLDANPANAGYCGGETSGELGKIRLEAFEQAFTGILRGRGLVGSPHDTYVPSTTAFPLRVVSVAGVAVKEPPSSSFVLPDVTINSGAAVPVVIETDNVPSGTVVKLEIFPETGPSLVIDFPALTGTGPKRTATANVVWPTGFSRGFVKASFTR